MDDVRGEPNLARSVRLLPHKAARLLEHLRLRGAGVTLTTKPWSLSQRDDAVARGSHKSAHMDRAFVFDELRDFCEQGYWIALPYSAVRNWNSVRVSPIGAVPQRDRRPRLIVDYSFSELNAETLQLAPAEAMQFGRALNRVLKRIVAADPRYGPVHLAKIDIADGFYRVWVQFNDVPKLGVVLPTSPGGATTDCVSAHPAHGVGGVAAVLHGFDGDSLRPCECTPSPTSGARSASSAGNDCCHSSVRRQCGRLRPAHGAHTFDQATTSGQAEFRRATADRIR